ncbi:hypothetical protein ACFSHT_30725 [Paraburkholderia silviterrae]|uniref:Uncharacterized protein n=1 Tax=Paraburkholderia silviterrae TaxID=2528715 RepID=A0A4R5LXT7_9BURK|nr:hypothetical protein [Paraburkholderia silviterrae]TDG16943.1 hypothetical protein EYW47_39275 [Paraburkholderia silviterrae]
MNGSWFRANKAAAQSDSSASAHQIASIVATLGLSAIMRSEYQPHSLSADMTATLAGYLYGFSAAICTAWAIADQAVAMDAGCLAIALIYPRIAGAQWANPESDSAAFHRGADAGRADGEQYVTSGLNGSLLPAMLATR